jgi:exosortase N
MLFSDLTTWLTVGLLVFAGQRSPWTGRLALLLLLSPALRYLSALFTFPIRLKLSAWAGSLLRLVGMNVVADGNVLMRNGQAMSVDPACMGLQMTGASLLVAIFLLIWYEKQAHRQVPIAWVILYGLLVFGFTIVCNLFRIILLVAFGILPDSWGHDIIGLFCVAIYTWLPAWVVARLLIRWVGCEQKSVGRPLRSMKWSLLGLLAGFGLMAYASRPNQAITEPCRLKENYGFIGYTCKPLDNGFVQLTKPGLLVYLKPLTDWYSLEHNPAVCWRGSGYELRHIRETTWDGHPAYIGQLKKRNQTLQTVWWFSNGSYISISQIDVRSRMLRGHSGFALINVTSSAPSR